MIDNLHGPSFQRTSKETDNHQLKTKQQRPSFFFFIRDLFIYMSALVIYLLVRVHARREHQIPL